MSTTSFSSWLKTTQPKLPLDGALAVVRLAEAGATLPFIARYRKEQTGNLDEVQIRETLDLKRRFDRLTQRQASILETLEKLKKLTPELRAAVEGALDADTLEDLYLPFKPKRQTKAQKAREAGLLPLADWIWNCGHGTETPQPGQTLELWAFTFRNPEKGVGDAAAAIQGAQDILTERLAEDPELRRFVRTRFLDRGYLQSSKAAGAKPSSKFERYFDHKESVRSLKLARNSHRYLAMRRGESESELKLEVVGPPDDKSFDADTQGAFSKAACTVADSPGAAVLAEAARLALGQYVKPSIDAEVHRGLKAAADDAATDVFAANLRRLLLEAPFGPKSVLGVDPGVRTGCKLALVDAASSLVSHTVLHLETEEGRAAAKPLLDAELGKAPVGAVAVGNGTAGREAEAFLLASIRESGRSVPVVMISEAGASVYSASDLARSEFPDLDVTVRGAISIARRLQDPLAELVKVDPRSIGVGQYQHDVAQALLKESLDGVVDSCVNQVGVNLNTASEPLLAHVSGIGPALAKAIVEQRAAKGLYKSRRELLEIKHFSQKTFEQAAGFLRVPDAPNPLDNTGVHPERYDALEALAARLGKPLSELLGAGAALAAEDTAFREEVGAFTSADIVAELQKPGRDPRAAFEVFRYREDVKDLKDLKPGMIVPGIVTNVTHFGAFVDVGVHQDGLVHLSQLGDNFVNDPSSVVHPGSRVSVRVLEVDLEKKQIALSMKTPRPKPKPRPARKPDKPKPTAARPPAASQPKPALVVRPLPPSRVEKPRPQRTDARPPRPPQSRPAPPPRRSAPPPAAPRPPKPSFNNPFAVLADLKKSLKD